MNKQIFQHHPVVGYHFIPGLKARLPHEGGGYLIRANAAGFRCDHEFERRRTPGRARVLLFGDSFTAGDGVSNKHRYGDVLETLVPELEVYNFGLSGTGTDQQYLVFREFARAIDADLVVLGVLVENVRRIAARYRPFHDGKGRPVLYAKPYYERDSDGGLQLHGVPVSKGPVDLESLTEDERRFIDHGGRMPLLRKALNKLGPRLKGAAQKLSGYDPVPAYSRPDHPDWLLMSAILEHWIAETSTPVLLFPIPLYQHVEETASAEPYRERFAELAERTGASLCDPLDHLLSFDRAERRALRFDNDVHPTRAGHRALAEALAGPVCELVPATTDTPSLQEPV